MQNLLGKSYEKILLLTSINFRGDYPVASANIATIELRLCFGIKAGAANPYHCVRGT
jgi:hypothetical protein